jgi:gamma-glutamylputrescine oxidase
MDFLTANDRRGEHAPSWYAATVGATPERPPLDGAARADLCVIGGGYAGLSTALHAAEAGLSVILIDAHRVGWGASGRNGGQLAFGPRLDIRKVEAKLGADEARRVWEVSTDATRLVKRLIATHAIACDLTPGYIEAGWRPADVEDAKTYVEHVSTRYGHPSLRWLPEAEMRARVDSPVYHGGLSDHEAGHLHPLAYALGLAAAAERAGARLCERTRATRIEEHDGAVRVSTERGAVLADRAVIACNGYLDDLDRGVAARVMPINNFIVATEPLGARAGALIPGGECVCDTRFVLNYFRLSRDGRLLFGGGETYSHRFPADIRAFVRRPLARVFPQLAEVRLDYGWGGTLAITRTRMPLFRRVGARTLSIGGWSGSGIHMATMGGMIAAEALRGETGRWDLMARAPAPPFPGGDRLRGALLVLAMTWYALRDRL